MSTKEERMQMVVDRVVANIAEYGWDTMYVFPVPGSDTVQFSYTIGFPLSGSPEFIIYGLEAEIARLILAGLFERVKAGERFTPGQVVDKVVDDYPVAMLKVRDTTDLAFSRMLLGGTGVEAPALQIVYPDAEGRWPWREGSRVADMPLLGSVPEELR